MHEIQTKILHWATGICLGIGMLVLLNLLQIPYYLYYPTTTQTILVSDTYDLYIFLISSACVPVTLALSSMKTSLATKIGVAAVWAVSLVLTLIGQFPGIVILYVTVISVAALALRQEPRKSAISETLASSLTIIALIESSCVFYWLVAALNPQGRVGVMSEQLESNLTFSLYPLAIPMLLLLLFSWLWIPLIMRLARLRTSLVVRYRPSASRWNVRTIIASLDLIAIIATIVFFYPYLAGQSWVVGVDSHLRYLDPLNSLAGLSLSQAINTSYEHGVYVAFLYLIEAATGLTAFSLVKYPPLLLAFALAAATYYVVLRAGWGIELAVLTSICMLLWLPTTLGIYAGIQANWIAIIFWMLFLSIYFTKSDWNTPTYIVLGLFSLLILLIHPWTWGVFVTTLALTALILRKSAWKQHCTRGFFAAVIIALPVGLGIYELLPGLSSDFVNSVQLYSLTAFNPTSILTFGDALIELFSNWGAYLPPTLLLFSLLGTSVLFRRQGIAANYLLAWIVTWCVGSILVAPVGYHPVNPAISETGLWRMMYVSPLPFLLAQGFEKCIQASRVDHSIDATHSEFTRPLQMASVVPFLALGGGLFALPQPIFRLLIVLLALGLTLLFLVRLPGYQVLQVLVVTVLVLLLVNAAFRSLFPLLLDPHNLPSPGTT